ncbi:BTAD domain-containing putative transcriptional regulator [Actinomadura sp. HBU206391]|uniref:BTAD domain-containing putative transcriptional regulator n=1 Tax=Actinomadura sp. HBU206391 TaxID=2731692 RepID=UPI00164FC9DD|nr:BTAD domain-containing putative transcriptional regulator [Actinomadura sp. HBU206391]MBC6462234.1 winged helix-turn-helix domain-containing protein [Actinomadura sp. HBU206391]
MLFGVLGPLAVWTADGEPVAVPGLKVRALLADLLVHEGRPVPADRLIDDLWGDDLPGNPAGALSAKVSQLRRVLEDAEPGGRELVLHLPAGYLLKADTDADRFRALIAEAGRAGEPGARAALLSDALASWRGPAFADFCDEPFTRAAITLLAEQRLTAQEDRAEAWLALGEHTALAGELGDLLAEHPLRERLRAAHMRALYRSGRQSEALDSYERLRALLADELGLDPGPGLVALHRAILTQDPALAAPAVVDPSAIRTAEGAAERAAANRRAPSLPAPLTDLIGRDDAVAEIIARLAADRLVTLTGPGGVGKTRLAVETAGRLVTPRGDDLSGPTAAPGSDGLPPPADAAGPFSDGVWLVELAALDRAADQDAVTRLAETIMVALDIRDITGSAEHGEPVTAVDRLTEALRTRRLLLVLDNCEHVVEPVAELAELLLRAAPGLRLLTTSQEPLGLAGEVVWSVPPLEVPDPAADLAALERTGSVRLFVARASAAARGFTLDTGTAPAVAVLCRRLDGIPLALELAATRVRALGVHGLVERLDDRFRLLATGHRGAPPRQQTLLAMIDWSWELLPGPERVVLRRLALHADGCTLEAAEAVCADGELDGLDVLDLLARLVDRSLVVMVDGADAPRYRLLESVAAYCVERLQEAGEFERVRRRHHAYYAALAEEAGPYLHGADQRRWLRRLDAEAANLRAALNTAVRDADAGGALRLVNAMTWYWFLRGRVAEARRSLAAALAVAEGGEEAPGAGRVPGSRSEASAVPVSARRAEARAWDAGIGFLHGDVADRDERRRAVLRLFEGVDAPRGRARAEWFLAYTGVDLGDFAVAEDLASRALPVFQALGDQWGTAAVLATRAKLAHVRGDLVALERDGERSAELFGELGDRWGLLEATGWLAGLAEMSGDLERAERLHRDGLRMAEELGLWTEVAGRLAWLGWIALQRGDYADAREPCERALRLAVEQGHQTGQIFAQIGLAFAARRDGHVDRAETHLRDMLSRTPRLDDEQVPPPYLPMILTELGFVAEQRGEAAVALALHLESLDLTARFAGSRDMPSALDGLAGALALAGDHDRAARFLGAAAAIRVSGSVPATAAEQGDIDRITARVRDAVGEDRFAAETELGGTLTPEELQSLVAATEGRARSVTRTGVGS